MNYKVGDEVICIDSVGVKNACVLELGRKYVVKEIHGPNCVSVGVYNPGWCPKCKAVDNSGHHHSWRFIKLDGLKEEQEQEMTA